MDSLTKQMISNAQGDYTSITTSIDDLRQVIVEMKKKGYKVYSSTHMSGCSDVLVTFKLDSRNETT